MNDHDLLVGLQQVFDANDPSDGIDRHDGHGRDYRVESLRIAAADDGFDDLEVTVRAGGEVLVSRLLFDRAWRAASGLDDVAACAAYVAARWQVAAVDESVTVGAGVPAADVLWRALEDVLHRDNASVNRVASGRLELVDEDGEVVTLHLTPQQWRTVVARAEALAASDSGEDAWGAGDGEAVALGELDELIGSRWDDEEHIVFFRGALHRSIRAELPPVRSMLLRKPLEDGDWFARAPDENGLIR